MYWSLDSNKRTSLQCKNQLKLHTFEFCRADTAPVKGRDTTTRLKGLWHETWANMCHICKPLKESRNRLPAWRNWIFGTIPVILKCLKIRTLLCMAAMYGVLRLTLGTNKMPNITYKKFHLHQHFFVKNINDTIIKLNRKIHCYCI